MYTLFCTMRDSRASGVTRRTMLEQPSFFAGNVRTDKESAGIPLRVAIYSDRHWLSLMTALGTLNARGALGVSRAYVLLLASALSNFWLELISPVLIFRPRLVATSPKIFRSGCLDAMDASLASDAFTSSGDLMFFRISARLSFRNARIFGGVRPLFCSFLTASA